MEERICLECGEEFNFNSSEDIPEKCLSCGSYFSLFKKIDLLSVNHFGIIIEELPRQDLQVPAP